MTARRLFHLLRGKPLSAERTRRGSSLRRLPSETLARACVFVTRCGPLIPPAARASLPDRRSPLRSGRRPLLRVSPSCPFPQWTVRPCHGGGRAIHSNPSEKAE